MNTVDLYQISRVILSSFLRIPRKQMTVLLETSLKDPLHSLNDQICPSLYTLHHRLCGSLHLGQILEVTLKYRECDKHFLYEKWMKWTQWILFRASSMHKNTRLQMKSEEQKGEKWLIGSYNKHWIRNYIPCKAQCLKEIWIY